jgi:signal transduction histidine kinase
MRMIQGAFRHRPGRVIALGRLVLAAVSMVAVWLDPSEPFLLPKLLLAFYDIWAAALLLLTWRNWWLDHRLAVFAHMVDIAVFGVLVYSTEGYTSPFYNFFVFLTLSAAIRWGWRETALTAVAVLLIYLTAGTASLAVEHGEISSDRLLIRFAYLIVLSLIIVWFRVNEQAEPDTGRREAETPLSGPPIDSALRLAARRMKAKRAVFVWSQTEEPWLNVSRFDAGEIAAERLAPDELGAFFADPVDRRPFLFDDRKRRGLARNPDDPRRLQPFRQRIDPAFASRFGVDEGLVIRIRAREFEGELFALEINGLCAEDLREAEKLGEEISSLLDDWSTAETSEEAAVNRARLSLARDLHDGAVQALAGAAFRLEGLKSCISPGHDAVAEIDTIKAELAEEQRKVRAVIAGLRGGRDSARRVDLGSGLSILAEQLNRRWGIACDLSEDEGPVDGPLWMEHELHQIIHEAAANAVRHGRATRLRVRLTPNPSGLLLDIEDNGRGVATRRKASPWSVSERVKSLGGSVALASDTGGTRLEIRLPLEQAA